MVQAHDGDEAIARLLEEAWPTAYRIARSLLRERAAAEDAVQEACARALASADSLRNPERFTVWFLRIVVNEAKQRLRDTSRQASVAVDLTRTEDFPPEDRIDVRSAIEQLNPTLRATVLLFYFADLPTRDIAAVMQTSPVAVRLRLMLARRRLRSFLRAAVSMSSGSERHTHEQQQAE